MPHPPIHPLRTFLLQPLEEGLLLLRDGGVQEGAHFAGREEGEDGLEGIEARGLILVSDEGAELGRHGSWVVPCVSFSGCRRRGLLLRACVGWVGGGVA